jgi:hypothetical protein
MFRHIKWWWQRRTRGFDDRELWNLDVTIAKFILPRLKRYKDMTSGAPSGLYQIEWGLILSDIIQAFEYIVVDDNFADGYKHRCIDKG